MSARPPDGDNRGLRVTTSGLDKAFGARHVLAGVDLDVRPGEVLAVVGRSGCGKTTLLRILAGLDRPSAGGVRFDGVPAQALGGAARMMFQEPRLLPWKTVGQNVALGLRGDAPGRQALVAEALDQVGLASRARDWPALLSGGQRQRVALARALVGRPRLLLLDEPLGALDALTRIEMQQLLERIWVEQKFTAVLVTHDVAEAVALADRVVVIDQGRIALDLDIPVARPRRRGSAELARLEGRILDQLFG